MSKKIIAGLGVVAGLAVALAPVATFAAEEDFERDTHIDRFNVTINPSCTFGKAEQGTSGQDGYVAPIAAVSHNANGSEATWSTTTPSDGTGRTKFGTTDTEDPNYDASTAFDANEAYNKSLDSAAITVNAGTKHSGFASTTLTIVCNSDDGYTLKASMANLYLGANTSSTYHIDPSTSYSATASGYAIDSVAKTAGESTATVVAGESAAIAPTSATPIAKNTDVSLETGDKWTITYGLGVGASQKAGTYTGDVTYTLVKGINAGA